MHGELRHAQPPLRGLGELDQKAVVDVRHARVTLQLTVEMIVGNLMQESTVRPTASGTPPTAAAMTDSPRASASLTTMPCVSRHA